METKVRTHVVISGKVQGVYYRYETKNAALKYNIKGWVKNNIDRTIEDIFEENQEDVQAILKWCEKGPQLSNVTNIDLKNETYTGEFDLF